jgi:hypothetical protein
MGKRKFFGTLISKTEGSVAVIGAIGLVVFLGVVSLAIDMGHLYTVRNELQNVADAAALAATNALIKDNGVAAERDAATAKLKALEVAQGQSKASNQKVDGQFVADDKRNDLEILFGTWNVKAADPSTAWTKIGDTCDSDSNANAVKITITRGAGTVYGPVSNLFAGFFGVDTSTVAATAIAYKLYINEIAPGSGLAQGPQVPLVLPSTGTDSPIVSNGRSSGWFARLFGPNEAVATTPTAKTRVFRDTGGANVTVNSSTKLIPTSPTAQVDPNHGYWYTGASSNSVPTTITNTLQKIYDTSLSGSSSAPALLPDLKVGQQVYPRSEYCYGRGYIGPIFQQLKYAYNYKTTGNKNNAPAAGTPWVTTVAVHGAYHASLPRQGGFTPLARLLTFFSPTQAYACATLTVPTISVYGFTKVSITDVKYNSTTSEEGVNKPGTSTAIKYPITIATPAPINNPLNPNKTTTYTDQKDFLDRYPNSTWNLNTATINSYPGASTVLSVSTQLTGGPSNQDINPVATTGTGMFVDNGAVLVK